MRKTLGVAHIPIFLNGTPNLEIQGGAEQSYGKQISAW